MLTILGLDIPKPMISLLFLIQGALAYELVALDFNFQYIDSQFLELQAIHKTPCMQRAISSFILECKIKGADLVDSEIRIILAVKLSICEFEETEVSYPESCRNPPATDNYKMCIQEFRGNSQLWTTYSGNYRKLRSICFEESFPFIKNHVIDLFYNITKIYSELFQETTNATKRSRAFQADFEKKFQLLLNLLSLALDHNQKQQDHMEEAFEVFETSMVSGYSQVKVNMGQMAEELMKDFNLFKEQLFEVNEVVTGMVSRYSAMDLRFAEQEEQSLQKRQEASGILLQDLVQLDKIIQDSTQKSSILRKEVLSTIEIGDELGHSLQDAVNRVEYWVENMDQTVYSLYSELSDRLAAKMESVNQVVDLQLRQIVDGTAEFNHQMRTHFDNVTEAVIRVENQISTLHFPLLFQGILGPVRAAARHVFLSLQIVVIVGLLFGAFRLRNIALNCFSFLVAMAPGFLIAFLLRAAIEAYLR